MYSITRKDAKSLAKEVEKLAKKVQTSLEKNGDYNDAANELIGKSTTLVFALGELHAVNNLNAAIPAKVKTAKKSTGTPRVYYRDKRGRFASKTTGQAYLLPKP